MLRYIVLIFLAVLLLSACGTATEEQPSTDEGDSPLVTVYRAPT